MERSSQAGFQSCLSRSGWSWAVAMPSSGSHVLLTADSLTVLPLSLYCWHRWWNSPGRTRLRKHSPHTTGCVIHSPLHLHSLNHTRAVMAPVEALADIFPLLPRCKGNRPLIVLCPILYFKHILTYGQAWSYLTPTKFQVGSLSLYQGSP